MATVKKPESDLEPRTMSGIPLKPTYTPEDLAARSELASAVRRLMDEFEKGLADPRETAIWREHLATSAGEPVSLATLGERFGVTKQRMGQIAEKLKREFRDRVLHELGTDIQMSWQAGNE